MTQALLKIDHLSKNFGSFQALNQLSLEVYPGDIYGFLGPNGAGKSTTLRIFLGLIYADGGEITFKGEKISRYKRNYINKIGALIERPDFYGNLTAFDNLKILASLSGVEQINKRVQEVLELVGLWDRKASKVKTFSQGMKQRLGIAQAIVHKPELVILDEPTNGLDPQGQADIRKIIRNINTEDKITVIFSSHVLKEVEDICNRMVIINKGTKIKEGTVNALMLENELRVSLKTIQPEKMMQLLQQMELKHQLINDSIIVWITEPNIPQLVERITSERIQLLELKQNRSLEEYFLKAINQ
ncbi:MAG: hypothetical protein AUK44_10745 [Porphyromonadaceae bacterium CG2_30_38_12]|nr:MAG: hypothetical protein AUK44_10745 [Porphyromonadaceae bacterium CG2_30_38_12]